MIQPSFPQFAIQKGQNYIYEKRETILQYQLDRLVFIEQNNLIMFRKSNKIVESWDNILKNREEIFSRNLDEFYKLVKAWRQIQELQEEAYHKELLLKYARYVEEANNYDRLKGPYFVKPIKHDTYLKNITSQKEFFLGINFLQQNAWRINFANQVIQKMEDMASEYVYDIFLRLYVIHEGYLNFNEEKPNCLMVYQRNSKFVENYFTIEIKINENIYYLLISIGINRFPYYNFNNFNSINKSKVQCFEHIMMITCQDIIQSSIFHNKKKMRNIIESLSTNYEFSLRMNYSRQVLIQDKEGMNQKFIYFHQRKKAKQEKLTQIYPTLFKKTIPNNLNAEKFNYAIDTLNESQKKSQFLSRQNGNEYYFNDEEDDNRNQSQLIEQLQIQNQKNSKVYFKNYQQILSKLEDTPNFKYALTNQQRQVICQQGNLIVVGRSGTGKTTVAMLRLYGIQFVVKFNEFNSLKKQGKIAITQKKCLMIIINEIKLMKNMFLTYSPKLIDQIKKQYDDMLYQIHERHSAKCQICKKTFKSNTIIDLYEQDPLDKRKRKRLEQQRKVVSLNQIDIQDFPGFFTIQNFIKVIDKSLFRSFFCYKKRQSQDNLYLKHTFINRYQHNEKSIDTVKAVYVDFYFFKQQIWNKLPKQFTKHSKEYFLITDSNVWSQIFSVIKGSANSYICPGGYLSFQMYCNNDRSIFHKEGQKMLYYKQVVYKIFKYYMNWCKNDQNAYDLMDVVNHILVQIEQNGYSGPRINYMFIDQVQDLTASTIFLISKMVLNNIFYCGDTAQAIIKGVTFRFQDLRFIFNKEYCKNALKLQPPKDIFNLTVNFRSHNFILELANSVVLSIQKLFPGLINKIKRQKSDLIGPKPFIIENQSKKILFHLICGQKCISQKDEEILLKQFMFQSENLKRSSKSEDSNRKSTPYHSHSNHLSTQTLSTGYFNSQQVIIVRNQQQKLHLPYNLQKGIILTPQTAKGLQYDEVILYNFFSSCQIYQKWDNLLQYLIPQCSYQDQKDFEEELSRRNKQEGKGVTNEPLSLKVKLLLGYDKQKKSYKIWNIKIKQNIREISINLYYELASQLKILYTAITRARSVFVIYDEKIPRNLLKLWNCLNLVKQVNQDNVEQCFREKFKYVDKDQKHTKYLNWQKKWWKAGEQMLARNDRDNAKKCYKNIGRMDLVERIQAQQIQIKAENQLFRIKNERKKMHNLSRENQKITKIKLQKQEQKALDLYRKAGNIYEKYGKHEDAGEAYYKGQLYQKSLIQYKKLQRIEKMADCWKKLDIYSKEAIKFFTQTKNIEQLFKCYIKNQQWRNIFQLLVDNPQYSCYFPENSKIDTFYCIKLRLIDFIDRFEQRYQYQYQDVRQQVKYLYDQKRIYHDKQSSEKIIQISLKCGFTGLQRLAEKLQKKAKPIKQLDLIAASKMQKYLNEKQAIFKEHNEFYQNRDQLQYLLYQLRQDLLKEQKNQLKQLGKDRSSYLMKRGKIQKRINQLQIQQERLFEQYDQKDKRLKQLYVLINQHQLTQKRLNRQSFLDIAKLQQKLSRIQGKNKILIQQFNKTSQSKIEQKNTHFQQNFSQISQLWDQQFTIGGIEIEYQFQECVIRQINQIVNKASTIVCTNVTQIYPSLHHKFIQQQMLKYFQSKSTYSSRKGIQALKLCNLINEFKTGLVICSYYKEFICLSPKYILGYLLHDSKNFNKKRYFKQQIYRIAIQRQKKIDFSKAEKIIMHLNQDALLHKIPKVGFQKTFYCSTIISQVALGLILQGHIKQVLMLCTLEVACKLTYLFSSFNQLIEYIKKIAEELNISYNLQYKYLFIENELFFRRYSEASVLNIFSFQNMFYSYDQCQLEPFLSKKKSPEQIDIEEDFYKESYDRVTRRVQTMKRKKYKVQMQIRQLKRQINYYEHSKNHAVQRRQSCYQIYLKQIKYLTEKQKKLEQNYKIAKQKFEELKNQDCNKILLKIDKYKKDNNSQEIDRWQKKKIYLDECQRYKANHERQLRENHEYYQILVKQNQNQINIIQYNMIQNGYKIRMLQTYLNKNKDNLSDKEKIQKYYKKNIQQNKIKMAKLQQDNLWGQETSQQIINKLFNKQISIQREKRHKKLLDKLRIDNMKQILTNSNIPKLKHYDFLTLYMKGKLNIKTNNKQVSFQKLSSIYQSILVDGINIEQLNKQKINKEIVNIKTCNIIIFYLSFICNNQFYNNVIDYVNQANIIYHKQYEQRSLVERNLKIIKNNLQYYKIQLEKFGPRQRIVQNKNYSDLITKEKDFQLQLIKYQKRLKQFIEFKENPQELLQKFLNALFRKIKTLKITEINFMQILFGFFQCRIIRDCEILSFLANQYILVRHNSIVIQKLLQQKNNIFAYYFDQQNTTVLCRFQDIQRIILGFISHKHTQLYKFNKYFQGQEIDHENKKKYLDRQILGYKKSVQTEQNQQLLKITQLVNQQKIYDIKQIYNNIFIGGSMMKEIKQLKQNAIEYLLKNQHTKTDSFFFAIHQIREYYFLEKTIQNMKLFNYQILKEVKLKKEALRVEFQKYRKQK